MYRKILLLVVFLGTPQAHAQDEKSLMAEKLTQAMAADIRDESDRDRDRNRKPIETLQFFGITPQMKVLELIPGGGWYTKLMAPMLRDNGSLSVAIGANGVKNNLLKLPNMDKINVIDVELNISDSETPRLRTVDPFSIGETGFDAVLTFRNMHNFDAAGRKNLNDAVFKSLEPGGIYGVVDHTLRHMQPFALENRRRADPVLMIKEIQEAGFEFVDYSDLHYRPDDELLYEVGRKSVTGNSDRFTLLFMKPK